MVPSASLPTRSPSADLFRLSRSVSSVHYGKMDGERGRWNDGTGEETWKG